MNLNEKSKAKRLRKGCLSEKSMRSTFRLAKKSFKTVKNQQKFSGLEMKYLRKMLKFLLLIESLNKFLTQIMKI